MPAVVHRPDRVSAPVTWPTSMTRFGLAAGGVTGGIGIKRRPVEEVPGAQVEAAPHDQRRAFPGVVARPEPRAGVGLAVLVPRLVVDGRVAQSTMSVCSTGFLVLDDVRQVGEDDTRAAARDATG